MLSWWWWDTPTIKVILVNFYHFMQKNSGHFQVSNNAIPAFYKYYLRALTYLFWEPEQLLNYSNNIYIYIIFTNPNISFSKESSIQKETENNAYVYIGYHKINYIFITTTDTMRDI